MNMSTATKWVFGIVLVGGITLAVTFFGKNNNTLPAEPQLKTYTNAEWGIALDIPRDWEAAVSGPDIIIEPPNPEPLTNMHQQGTSRRYVVLRREEDTLEKTRALNTSEIGGQDNIERVMSLGNETAYEYTPRYPRGPDFTKDVFRSYVVAKGNLVVSLWTDYYENKDVERAINSFRFTR